MKKQETVPNVKLQKSSILFMQLGLILAMLFVYIALEHESLYFVKKMAYVTNSEEPEKKTIAEFTIEKKKSRKKRKIKKVKVIVVPKKNKVADKIKIVTTEKKIEETLFEAVDTNSEEKVEPNLINSDDIPSSDDGPITDDEPVDFVKVEIAPTFPGCESETTNEGRIACFNKSISSYIKRKFDFDLVQELGLEEGKKRIRVEFVIDANGNVVNVKVRGPHIKLEKEANRVISNLPKFKPAKQRLTNVPVRYRLPITIKVEEE